VLELVAGLGKYGFGLLQVRCLRLGVLVVVAIEVMNGMWCLKW
jgi:hypothetical protein